MTTSRITSCSVLALTTVALFAGLAWMVWGSGAELQEPTIALAPGESAESGVEPTRSPAADTGEFAPPPETMDAREPNAPLPLEVLCVADEDGSTLKGVRAYLNFGADNAEVCGPSDEQGRLELPSDSAREVLFWAPRRTVVRLPLDELSREAEVRMVSATCAFDLVLTEMTNDHELIRSTIVLRDTTLRAGPWTPKLEPGALDVFSADGLTPGTYDVFFWIKRGREAPRAHQVRGIELTPHERKRVSHSAEAALPEDEDDS